MLLAFRFISVVILATCLVIANAQPQKCASLKQREKKMQQDPSLKLNQIEARCKKPDFNVECGCFVFDGC